MMSTNILATSGETFAYLHSISFIYLFIYTTLGFSEMNNAESIIRVWGCDVKAAYYTAQSLPAAVESRQEKIYFPEVPRIDNVLSARLYEMKREKQLQWVGREIAHPVKQA